MQEKELIIKQAKLIKQIFQIEDIELLEEIRLVIEKTIEEYKVSKNQNLLNELHGS